MLKLKMHMFFVSYMYIQKKKFYMKIYKILKKYMFMYIQLKCSA